MSKEHSGSLFIEQGLLELLDFIAYIECQSRAVIVERILKYYFMQQRKKHGKKGSDPNKKKRMWKSSKSGVYQNPQKVFTRYSYANKVKILWGRE
ncbi:hypothetical protein [Helicobacter suis]|nr:hypothetical protein [Helicobacter suis]